MTIDVDELADERSILLQRIEKRMRFIGTYRRCWHDIPGMTTEQLKKRYSGLDYAFYVYSDPYENAKRDLDVLVWLLKDWAFHPGWNSFVNFLKKKIRAVQSPQQRHKLRTLLRHVRTNKVLMTLLKALVNRTYWQADGNYVSFAAELDNLLKRRSLTDLFNRAPMEFASSEEYDILVAFQLVGDPTYPLYDEVCTRDRKVTQNESKQLIAPTKKVIEIFGSRDNYFLCSLREYTALLNDAFSSCLVKG